MIVLALVLAGSAPSGAGELCDPVAVARVSLLILANAERVQTLAKSIGAHTRVLARDDATVVFEDGRVLTSDPSGASRHLNALGWGAKPIDLVASFVRSRSLPARRRRG